MKKIIGILICTLLIATAVPSMATILTEKQNLNASDGTGNQPPTTPTISGLVVVYKGATHTYKFASTDPDNDKVEYLIGWGEQGIAPTWTGLLAGSPCRKSHSWTEQDSYLITAIARDEHGLKSGMGTLVVYVFPPLWWSTTGDHALYTPLITDR